MTHQGTKQIETPRIILRRFVPEDIVPFYENCLSDKAVWGWMSYDNVSCIDDVKTNAGLFTEKWFEAYERPNRYSWAVELRSTGECVGRVFGMHPDDRVRQVELAAELAKKCWNQGLMTEALKATIDFFFREVGFNRIYAYHADKNPASGRMMQKCGMTYEGTARQGCSCNNGIFDAVNYAILACDYFGTEGK